MEKVNEIKCDDPKRTEANIVEDNGMNEPGRQYESHASIDTSAAPGRGTPITLEMIAARLDKIEENIVSLVLTRTIKEWYSTAEIAKIEGKDEFTVREWCRNGRMLADKRQDGRGKHKKWAVSHHELLRYQRDGLLPKARPTSEVRG